LNDLDVDPIFVSIFVSSFESFRRDT